MKPPGRILLAFVAGSLLAVGLAETVVYATNLKTQRGEETLLRKVAALHVGTTTLQDCRPILDEYTPLIHDPSIPGRPAGRQYLVAEFNHFVNNSIAHLSYGL